MARDRRVGVAARADRERRPIPLNGRDHVGERVGGRAPVGVREGEHVGVERLEPGGDRPSLPPPVRGGGDGRRKVRESFGHPGSGSVEFDPDRRRGAALVDRGDIGREAIDVGSVGWHDDPDGPMHGGTSVGADKRGSERAVGRPDAPFDPFGSPIPQEGYAPVPGFLHGVRSRRPVARRLPRPRTRGRATGRTLFPAVPRPRGCPRAPALARGRRLRRLLGRPPLAHRRPRRWGRGSRRAVHDRAPSTRSQRDRRAASARPGGGVRARLPVHDRRPGG